LIGRCAIVRSAQFIFAAQQSDYTAV